MNKYRRAFFCISAIFCMLVGADQKPAFDAIPVSDAILVSDAHNTFTDEAFEAVMKRDDYLDHIGEMIRCADREQLLCMHVYFARPVLAQTDKRIDHVYYLIVTEILRRSYAWSPLRQAWIASAVRSIFLSKGPE